jgi:hypothetical protein
MRFRVKADKTSYDVVPVKKFEYFPCTGSMEDVDYEQGRNYGVMWDVEVPNFTKRKAAGEVFFNGMYSESLTSSVVPATFAALYKYQGRSDYCNGKAYVPTAVVPITSSSSTTTGPALIDAFLQQFDTERGIAVAKAWANVDETELLAYATIGELPETVRWLGDLYRRGIGIVKLFTSKKARLKYEFQSKKVSGKDQLDAMSNMWLEMRYAVRPLLFEMEQLVAALESEGSPPRRTARGYNEKEETSTSDAELYLGSNYYIHGINVVQRQSVYRAGVLYDINLDGKNWAAVLGLDQPLETIWELTRLSFLLDWFFNVGTLISAWTPNANLNPLGSWVTETHTFTYTAGYTDFRRVTPDPNWECIPQATAPGTLKATHEIKRRSITPQIPVLPSVKINLDWAKIVDIATIARSFYRALKS